MSVQLQRVEHHLKQGELLQAVRAMGHLNASEKRGVLDQVISKQALDPSSAVRRIWTNSLPQEALEPFRHFLLGTMLPPNEALAEFRQASWNKKCDLLVAESLLGAMKAEREIKGTDYAFRNWGEIALKQTMLGSASKVYLYLTLAKMWNERIDAKIKEMEFSFSRFEDLGLMNQLFVAAKNAATTEEEKGEVANARGLMTHLPPEPSEVEDGDSAPPVPTIEGQRKFRPAPLDLTGLEELRDKDIKKDLRAKNLPSALTVVEEKPFVLKLVPQKLQFPPAQPFKLELIPLKLQPLSMTSEPPL